MYADNIISHLSQGTNKHVYLIDYANFIAKNPGSCHSSGQVSVASTLDKIVRNAYLFGNDYDYEIKKDNKYVFIIIFHDAISQKIYTKQLGQINLPDEGLTINSQVYYINTLCPAGCETDDFVLLNLFKYFNDSDVHTGIMSEDNYNWYAENAEYSYAFEKPVRLLKDYKCFFDTSDIFQKITYVSKSRSHTTMQALMSKYYCHLQKYDTNLVLLGSFRHSRRKRHSHSSASTSIAGGYLKMKTKKTRKNKKNAKTKNKLRLKNIE